MNLIKDNSPKTPPPPLFSRQNKSATRPKSEGGGASLVDRERFELPLARQAAKLTRRKRGEIYRSVAKVRHPTHREPGLFLAFRKRKEDLLEEEGTDVFFSPSLFLRGHKAWSGEKSARGHAHACSHLNRRKCPLPRAQDRTSKDKRGT